MSIGPLLAFGKEVSFACRSCSAPLCRRSRISAFWIVLPIASAYFLMTRFFPLTNGQGLFVLALTILVALAADRANAMITERPGHPGPDHAE